NERSEALKPYTEIREIKNESSVITTMSNKNMGLEKSTNKVTNIVRQMPIKMPLTLRFKLPGISAGAFKKAPITIDGAHSKCPKKFRVNNGLINATVSTMPLKKWAPFKNNSKDFKYWVSIITNRLQK